MKIGLFKPLRPVLALINKIVDFEFTDDDLDPICLKGKYWELIKVDFKEIVRKYV